MKFQIKNFKHAEFASEETNCFEATLYLDGKRFCIVSNDGQGAENNYYPLPNSKIKQNELWKEISTIDKELGVEVLEVNLTEDRTYKLNNCLDLVVSDLVNAELYRKDAKKLLKKIAYMKNNNIYVLPSKFKPTEKNIVIVKSAKWWKSDFVLLNDLSVDEVAEKMAEVA